METEKLLENCRICPLECGTNRLTSVGACGVSELKIAKYYLHPFEEPCISFKNGSGTIFFTGCNLKCPFCQNYEVSRAKRGKSATPRELADIFKELEDMGAENISLVTPTHLIAYLLRAFEIYKPKIPVVYNTGGYEKISSLELINPFIDIYLPDMKFYSSSLSQRYLGREDYFDVASEAVSYMASQKPLKMTKEGKMLSGVIVRHLVMPLGVRDSKAILKWFTTLPKDVYLSLMSQYTPFGNIENYPELSRPVTKREYSEVLDSAFSLGIENLFAQDLDSIGKKYIPTWDF